MSKEIIEAEKNELILRNKNGDIAIIPAKHRTEVLGMIDDDCTDCLNHYIKKLPQLKDLKK